MLSSRNDDSARFGGESQGISRETRSTHGQSPVLRLDHHCSAFGMEYFFLGLNASHTVRAPEAPTLSSGTVVVDQYSNDRIPGKFQARYHGTSGGEGTEGANVGVEGLGVSGGSAGG